MKIKVLLEKEVWVNVPNMKTRELLELRDNDPQEYDRIVNNAFDRAIIYAQGKNPLTFDSITLIDYTDNLQLV